MERESKITYEQISDSVPMLAEQAYHLHEEIDLDVELKRRKEQEAWERRQYGNDICDFLI